MFMRVKNSKLRVIMMTFVMLCFFAILAHASNNRTQVYIFNTKQTPQSKEVIKGLKKGCGKSGDIHMYDMKGKLREGKNLVDEMKSHLRGNNDKPKVIYTMGDPATSLVQNEKFEETVFYSLVTQKMRSKVHRNNMHNIELRTPFVDQLTKFKGVVGNIGTIGIIYSEGYNSSVISELKKAASIVGIKLNLKMVGNNKDVPKALRDVMSKNDAIMFIPDPVIINKDSYRFIIRIAIENNKPTLVYSEHLTKAGFLFALELDYYETGVSLGKKLCDQPTTADMRSVKGFEPQKFISFLNDKTLVLIGHKK